MDHAAHDHLSLALAERIAAELPANPQWIELARANLARWRALNSDAPALVRCYDEWLALLDEPVECVQRALVARHEEGRRLRQNSPFAGVLPPHVVWAVKQALRDEQAAA